MPSEQPSASRLAELSAGPKTMLRFFKSIFKMVSELSSNWKKIQATIKPPSAVAPRQIDIKNLSEREKNSIAKRRRLNEKGQSFPVSHTGTIIEGNLKIPSDKSLEAPSQSLAFWEIPSKDILEAYGGKVLNEGKTITVDAVNGGIQEDVEIGKYVAIDCEMVGVGGKDEVSILARISIVNFHGTLIYDSFVKPTQPVTNWRTKVSGVSPAHMETARKFKDVQQEVASILKDRILVGHALSNDFAVLHLKHPTRNIRDTSVFSGFRRHAYGRSRLPALRNLAKSILGLDIQRGEHSSIEDARVTMLIFKRHKAAMDAERYKHPEVIGSKHEHKPKSKKKSKAKVKAAKAKAKKRKR